MQCRSNRSLDVLHPHESVVITPDQELQLLEIPLILDLLPNAERVSVSVVLSKVPVTTKKMTQKRKKNTKYIVGSEKGKKLMLAVYLFPRTHSEDGRRVRGATS